MSVANFSTQPQRTRKNGRLRLARKAVVVILLFLVGASPAQANPSQMPVPPACTVGGAGPSHASIQVAVDDPACDTVIVAAGTYYENIVITRSVKIVGAGGETGATPTVINGGPTLTHELLAGSPAIDTGLNGNCRPVDQRGAPRPYPSSGSYNCDKGAFEVSVCPLPATPTIIDVVQNGSAFTIYWLQDADSVGYEVRRGQDPYSPGAWNDIIIPIDQVGNFPMTSAGLAADIGGVTKVAVWDRPTQSWTIWQVGDAPFNVYPGTPTAF